MDALATVLYGFGPLGIAAAIALYIFRHMYLKIEDLQEKRIEEMRANLADRVSNTAVLTANTQALQGNNQVIQTLVTSINNLPLLLAKGK